VSGLRLELTVPDEVPLDEVLLALVRLVNDGAAPLTTSSRLNLVEGDLEVVVAAPGGTAIPARWPWPVDSMPRQVELAPGQAITGSAVILTAGSEPLFEAPGVYTLTATFMPSPGVSVSTGPVRVRRPEVAGPERRKRRGDLADRAVVQSLASASVLSGAAEGVARLAETGPPVARVLALLATADVVALSSAAADAADAVLPAAAVAAVLPPGLYREDERRDAITTVVTRRDDDGTAAALLDGAPYTPSPNRS
jgi:hypothetical protein